MRAAARGRIDVSDASDLAAMADLAQGRMRAKIEQLTEALTGRFNDHHRFMVTFRLQRIDQTKADVARLDARIDELIAEHGCTWRWICWRASLGWASTARRSCSPRSAPT